MSDAVMSRVARKQPSWNLAPSARDEDFVLIADRKASFSEHVATDYINIVDVKLHLHARASPKLPMFQQSATLKTNYPHYLVKCFGIGLVLCVFGGALLIGTMLWPDNRIRLPGAILFALGSVTVALSLLRGQDLDERN